MAKEVQNTRSGEIKKTAEDLDEFLSKVRTSSSVSNDEILGFAKLFNDELTLDNIRRPQLVNMCKYMGINPFGTDAYLRFMLRKRLQWIKNDDKMIEAEGVESLSEAELWEDCRERGMLGFRSVEEMRHQVMEKEKVVFDCTLDPRDDDMEVEDDVACLTSGGGGEGTSNPGIEIESVDDVTFEGEDKDPIEQVENDIGKRKLPPKGKTPKKFKESRETHEPSKRQRAPCWDHFDDFMKDGKKWARCKYCGKEYAADSKKHGATNLNAHTPVCRMYPYRDQDGHGVEVAPVVFSQADCQRALEEMIIIDKLPPWFVEGVGFRRFCEVIQPNFENGSDQTITREVGAINKSP